jgi:hypothetical protein
MESRFQPSRLLPPVFLILGLVLVSYLVNPEPWHHLSVFAKAAFGGTALVFALLMLVLRGRSYLRMDMRGLEVHRGFGAPEFFPWQDVEGCTVIRKRFLFVPIVSSIGVKLRPGARPRNPVRRAAGAMLGYDATFPAWFDQSAVEIAEKIETMRQRYRVA